jgi:outer membrane protein OmpA-like peptidoglycan-associated protein
VRILPIIALLIGGCIFSQEPLRHDVFFETDKFDITETEFNRLSIFIDTLKTKDVVKISIYGFCDDIGSESYNLKLSNNRAQAIKLVLSKYNVSPSLINEVDGKGEILLKIIDSQDPNILRGFNRKAEIIAYQKPIVILEEEELVEKETSEILKSEDLEVGDQVLLKNILFETGHRRVLDESKPVLDTIATILKEREDIYFTIQGHVCCTKYTRDAVDIETNKRNLSLARAKYVYDYLAKEGINKKRMKYVGLRRKFPLGGDPKFDRRVEILITYIRPEED